MIKKERMAIVEEKGEGRFTEAEISHLLERERDLIGSEK